VREAPCERNAKRDNLGPETRRTPWSAAGRKKPATCSAEQTVEVGRNDKDGTSPEIGISGPKVATEYCTNRIPSGRRIEQSALTSQEANGSGR